MRATARGKAAGLARRLREANRVVVAGTVIGAAWVVLGALTLTGAVGPDAVAPFILGAADGFLPMQLLTYPFVHESPYELAFNLLWLVGLVNISRQCQAADGFVRIFSLGVVGGGLAYLLVCGLLGRVYPLTGGLLPLTTMLGALAVVHGGPVCLFGETFQRTAAFLWREYRAAIAVALVVLGLTCGCGSALVTSLYRAPGGSQAYDFINAVWLDVVSPRTAIILTYYLDLAVMACFRVRLRLVVAVWLLARAAQYGLLSHLEDRAGPVLLPTVAAGLLTGLTYGGVAWLWGRGSNTAQRAGDRKLNWKRAKWYKSWLGKPPRPPGPP
jgi:membrane associated rhomboid family serine protease